MLINLRNGNLLCGFASAFLAAGCQKPIVDVSNEPMVVQVPDDDAFDRLWEASQEALRRHRMPLDWVNPATGTIRTFPVTSKQFFEFWRNDVATRYDVLEASLATIRRTAVIKVHRLPEQGECEFAVVVNKEKYSAPERQVSNSAGVLQVFGDVAPTVEGRPFIRELDERWIPLGRDPALEDRITAEILARAALGG